MPKTSLELKQMESKKKQEKRDKLDLMLEILIACSEPVKKTHLLYRTKVNYAQLTRYISLLVQLGMVEEISEPLEGYIITEKGRITLELFHAVKGYRGFPDVAGAISNAAAPMPHANSGARG